MADPTTNTRDIYADLGWVTFQWIRLPDGRVLLGQKNNGGGTRTVITTSQKAGVR